MATEAVKVAVRCRPMNGKEKGLNCFCVIEMDSKRGTVAIINPNNQKERKDFSFDAVFDWTSEQHAVYAELGYPLVINVLEGFNGTIFAYGQTGCGKSHSMTGVVGDANLKGIIPRALDQVFDAISTNSDPNLRYLVTISYLEIYNEEIRDLLSDDVKRRLELKEHPDKGVYVKDLGEHIVSSIPEIDKWMEQGNKMRVVGETAMNATSSRSHSIFTIAIGMASVDSEGNEHTRQGKLNLVDLAGSERQSKTEATGQRLKEAAKINLSLSALGNVISALVDGKSSHVPYRDSKLTRLLQDSLGGNSKTVMLTALSPADYNYDESMSTLRYASRAKSIKNKPKINEDPKDAMIRQFQEEIKSLQEMLQKKGMGLPLDAPLPSMQRKIKGVDNSLMNEIRSETDEQIRKILTEKGMLEEEQNRIIAEIHQLNEQEAREAAEKAELEGKLAAMQEKLMVGGVNLMDAVEQQKARLRMQDQELEQQQLERDRLERLKAQQEEQLMNVDTQYSSLQEEVDEKNNKLKKLWSKVQMGKQEITDLQEEYQKDREDILENIRLATKTLKLRALVLDSFIPPDDLASIEARARYDDDQAMWTIRHIGFSGNRRKNMMVGDADFEEQQLQAAKDAYKERQLEQRRVYGDVFLNYSNQQMLQFQQQQAALQQQQEYDRQQQEQDQQYYEEQRAETPPSPSGVRMVNGRRTAGW